MVWAWMLRSSYALETRTRLWFGHRGSGQRMLWKHERDYGLGMDALVIVGSGIVWAWMLWSAYALGTRTRLWFGHGCSGHRRLWDGLGMDALVSVCSGNTNEIMVWDALVSVCSGNTKKIMVWAWMLWSSYALGIERDSGLGMDALVSVGSGNTNEIMVWAWKLVSSYALGRPGYRKCCAGCAERQLASC